MLILLLAVVIVYGALVGGLYLAQRSLIFPGAIAAPVPERADWGEIVSIRTPDGETLHGLYTAASSGKPSVLLFFGNADHAGAYGFLSQMLAARGIGLLAISYRGYAGSTGSPSEEGLLIDGLAAFDWLSERSNRIVVLGRSLGTGIAVNTAAERPAAGVILISPYLSIASVAGARFPYFPVGLLIRDPFRSDLRIGKVKQPKLFLHGRKDTIIPLASGEALYANASEPKQMRIDDMAGHNDIWNGSTVSDIFRFVDELPDV